MNQVTQTPLNKADATSLKGKTLKWRIVTEVFWLVYLSQTSFRVHVSNCCIVFHYVWFWFQDFTAIEVLCYTKAIKHKQLRCQLTLERIQFMLSDRRDSPVRFPARRTEAFALVILFIIRGKKIFVINYSIILTATFPQELISCSQNVPALFLLFLKSYMGKNINFYTSSQKNILSIYCVPCATSHLSYLLFNP